MAGTPARPAYGRSVWTRILAVALPVGFVLVWSSGYLVGTIGARSGAQLALVAWRFLLALVVLASISLATRAPWPREPRVYVHLLITGALLQTVQLGGVYFGLGQGVPAGLSSLILSLSPLLVAAAAVPLFSERLAVRQWLGLGLGLVGVAISLNGRLSGDGQLLGYVCTGVAVLGFVAGTLYQKRFGRTVDLRAGTTVQLLGATLTAFPLALANGGLGLPMTASALGSLAWLGTVNSIGAFTLLFVLLRRRTGGAATSLLYLVPPVTALLAVPLLGQSITAYVVVGMLVSGAGVVLALTARSAPGRSSRGVASAVDRPAAREET